MATSDLSRKRYSTDISSSEVHVDITDTFTLIACQCMLYGVQITLTLFVGYTLLFAQTRSKAIRWLLPLTVVMLASSTIYVIFTLEVAVYFSNYSGDSVPYEVIYGMQEALLYLPSVNYLCSDIILFWRAYVLWNSNRRVFILPASLLAGTLVALLASIGSKGETSSYNSSPSLSRKDLAVWALYSSWVLTLAANIVLTLIIGFKAWQYSRFFTVSGLGRRSSKLVGVKIIIAIVESGAVYCVFLLFLVILNFQLPPSESLRSFNVWKAGSIIQDVSIQISGIYPIIIIVMVALKRSIADTAPADTSLPSFVAGNRDGTTSTSIAQTQSGGHRDLERRFESNDQSTIHFVGFGAFRKSGETDNQGEANSAFTEAETTA